LTLYSRTLVADRPKGKTGKANWVLNHIQKLYRIETKIKGETPKDKYRIPQAEALPLLTQFKVWLDKTAPHVPPKTAQGKAIGYSLNQWPKLIRYIEDGNLNIDNNRAERAIKPFVIGRKNWLFSNTASGANASATLYSLIDKFAWSEFAQL
jgi:transposase